MLEDIEDPRWPDWPMVSSLVAPIRGHSEFKLPPTMEAYDAPGRNKFRSFATVEPLTVVYSPRDISFDEVVARLRAGTLDVPRGKISAIEVGQGEWLTTQFVRQPSGFYAFQPGSTARSLFVSKIDNRPDAQRMPSGIVVFLSQPHWAFAQEKDFRPREEIVEAAEKWLGRARHAVDDASGVPDMVERLRNVVASTIDEDEKADLSAAIRMLAERQSLVEVMPQMLLRDAVFQGRMKEFEAVERERIKAALQSSLQVEMDEEKSRLVEIRNEIADAETRLALAGKREVLLRAEVDKHDEALRARIAEVAHQIDADAKASANKLHDEVAALREMVAELATRPETTVETSGEVSPPSAVQAEAKDHDLETPVEPKADDDARKSIIAGLSSATGLTAGDIVAILLKSTEDIPVLIGEKASSVAADIVAAIGGESAVAFCDPSRISWQDLMRDETSDLASAVAKAKVNPDILVPVAICGITNGPCEYWIPQLVESRRIGRLPRNLAIIASAGVDGMRVSVPDSILRFLMPVAIPDTAKPVRRLYAGGWTAGSDADRARPEAMDILSRTEALSGAALQRATKALSRVPPGVALADVGQVFLRHAAWLASITADGQYEFKNNFKKIEG
ncbi:hypothetical protein [Rhizobium leguminosarum]|uniref:hypothetical protein n=1 Tax=Rhizobium leguminosarum TaxID=384 RepID=UPI001FDF1C0E|nr:hypothetical protein [Rhizobium leguminosarum]